MLPQLKEIKVKRKQLDLTQKNLARESNVSQSLIAKTESFYLVPSYDKAKRIFDALDRIEEKQKITAKDLMNRKVYCISPNESLRKAINAMKKNSVEQLPVIEEKKAIGMVSEKMILELLGGKRKIDLDETKVRDIMGDSFPIIQEETPFQLVNSMLRYSQALLIAKKGKILGIISNSDVLKALLEK